MVKVQGCVFNVLTRILYRLRHSTFIYKDPYVTTDTKLNHLVLDLEVLNPNKKNKMCSNRKAQTCALYVVNSNKLFERRLITVYSHMNS